MKNLIRLKDSRAVRSARPGTWPGRDSVDAGGLAAGAIQLLVNGALVP